MKKVLATTIALAFASLLGAAQAAENAIYFVAQVKITDQNTYFNEYGAQVGPMLLNAGAEILAATPDRNQLEGEWSGNWTVIIKFPSEEKALGWYRSDEYQAIRPLRLQSTSENNLVLVPRFIPPQ